MSTQPKPDYREAEISESALCEYLESHPDFFERNPSLLSSLRLPHAAGGAVSLVERQVSVLRQKELKLERKLKDLIGVARDNDVLAAKIHALSLQLIQAPSRQATVAAVEEAVRAGFGADQARLVMFGAAEQFGDIEAGRFCIAIERTDEQLKPFATLLESSAPRCGQARDAQLEFLFRGDATDIGSVAMVPLGEKSELGLLAIGSHDAERFHPGMSIDFLSRVGDLIAVALQRYG